MLGYLMVCAIVKSWKTSINGDRNPPSPIATCCNGTLMVQQTESSRFVIHDSFSRVLSRWYTEHQAAYFGT